MPGRRDRPLRSLSGVFSHALKVAAPPHGVARVRAPVVSVHRGCSQVICKDVFAKEPLRGGEGGVAYGSDHHEVGRFLSVEVLAPESVDLI